MVSFFTRPGGAKMGYVVRGEDNINQGAIPLIIINGMAMIFEDWDVISKPLSEKRPVLLFDHRDIGASIVPTSSTEDLSIALLAADVIALVESLGWGEVDMMGFSMGGSVLQQILVTPALPFYIGHAILAATTTKAPHSDPVFLQLLMPRPSKSGASLTQQQLKLRALAFARQMTELGYDEEWLSDPMNRAIVEAKIPDMIVGRPAVVIARQALTVRDADHRPNLHLVPASTKVLVIHGTLDRMISYSESNYILEGIPHARRVAVGRDYGQVPSEKYGHTWFDYFEPEVWVGVFEGFLDDRVQAQKAQIGPVASGGVKAKL